MLDLLAQRRTSPLPKSEPDSSDPAKAVGLWPDTDHPTIADLLNDSEEVRQKALLKLFRAYEKPVLRFLKFYVTSESRYASLTEQDVEDIASKFYVDSLVGKKCHFLSYDSSPLPGKTTPARLRTYFKTILEREVSNFARKKGAQKRGDGAIHESLNTVTPEPTIERLTPPGRMPFACFDREWAHHIIETAINNIRSTNERQQQLQEALFPLLCGEPAEESLKSLAERHGFSHNAVRMAYCRLKIQWREELRRLTEKTLEDPTDLEDELAYLAEVLAQHPLPTAAAMSA